MAISRTQICFLLVTVLAMELDLRVTYGHEVHDHHHHQCGHSHHDHHHHQGELENGVNRLNKRLPEELAEEEDLKTYGFGSHDHHDHDERHGALELTRLGLWVRAMGCSLLVSLASLVCLIILPLLCMHGKPSKTVVDALAVFGAGAMLGDAFLHQLPHAFGGDHSHSHTQQAEHGHHHSHIGHEHSNSHSHSHSLSDLSVGMSVLAGIVLFFLVEKLVRYVEDTSRGVNSWGHHHHHHHHMRDEKLKDDTDAHENLQGLSTNGKSVPETLSEGKESLNGEGQNDASSLRKRNTKIAAQESQPDKNATSGSTDGVKPIPTEPAQSTSSLVFGYLNLFSDGVHNFTDGMALGNAFLLYGSVGGWSRTLFLLAHELPQEIGDFGILVRSGFSVSKALLFNFLSALVALAGTALALVWGQDPGQSSLIEGFTGGGFMYISLAGVLAEVNSGSSGLRNMLVHLTAFILGISVALSISLLE